MSSSQLTLKGFMDLPLEIQLDVLRLCERVDLLSLARTSKALYDIASLLIYRKIDISYHNDSGLFLDSLSSKPVHADHPKRHIPLKDYEAHQKRQRQFLRSLTDNPSLALLVKELIWSHNSWLACSRPDLSQAFERSIWKIFETLINVKAVGLCCYGAQSWTMLPPPLFPAATTIRLSGEIRYAALYSFISEPSKVENLELNNLLGVAQKMDGQFHSAAFDEDDSDLEAPASATRMNFSPETEIGHGRPILRHGGPMRGHLNFFTGTFTSLRRLCIRIVGQDYTSLLRWSAKREALRYQELASFIASTSTTLECLIFEQGIVLDHVTACNQALAKRHQIERPMDETCKKYIVPTIASIHWPKLKHLTIWGVEKLEMEMVRFGKLLRQDVCLDWKHEASRTFYYPPNIIYPFEDSDNAEV